MFLSNELRLRLLAVAITVLMCAGLWLVGTSATAAKQTPATTCATCPQIQHVVIIVKENHSFDNIFGQFPGANGTNVAQEGTNSVLMGILLMSSLPTCLHSSSAALEGVNGGKMNDFYKLNGSNENGQDVSDSEYEGWQIPDYYQYASQYALADHFFSTVMGPSFPNHLALIQGNADHVIGNPHGPEGFNTWGCSAAHPSMWTPITTVRPRRSIRALVPRMPSQPPQPP